MRRRDARVGRIDGGHGSLSLYVDTDEETMNNHTVRTVSYFSLGNQMNCGHRQPYLQIEAIQCYSLKL